MEPKRPPKRQRLEYEPERQREQRDHGFPFFNSQASLDQQEYASQTTFWIDGGAPAQHPPNSQSCLNPTHLNGATSNPSYQNHSSRAGTELLNFAHTLSTPSRLGIPTPAEESAFGFLPPQASFQGYGSILGCSSQSIDTFCAPDGPPSPQKWQSFHHSYNAGMPHQECPPFSERVTEAMVASASQGLPDQRILKSVESASNANANAGQTKRVCFGMVPKISARWDQRGAAQAPSPSIPVQLTSSTQFASKGDLSISGTIASEHGQMIQGLLSEESLDLYTSCITDTQTLVARKPRTAAPVQCTLEITVYGPLDLFEEIGTWFEEYQVYLQDPRECHVNAVYCNPHRLSSDDTSSCPLLSEVVNQASRVLHLENITPQHDLLDILSSNDELEEAPQPSIIKGNLRRHQKQALTFMLRREQGWAFHDRDVWEIIDSDQGRVFLNRISNAHQAEEPTQCYGGIIADPMGLGKTLTMIALAATDLDSDDGLSSLDFDEDEHGAVQATLIVVPPPLIGAWEEQLSEHVVEGGLRCRRHHRDTRITSTIELERLNVVLTTYHTVSAEWNSGGDAQNSVLFSVRWRRIILDEAHLIRNVNARMSRAICALSSVARWAVTGTPIQNRLSDLASLFKFIRAHPYTDSRCFEADISRLWKSGEDEEAVKRLKRLSACLLLRRSKGTINLPPRRDMLCPIDFNREERALYETLRQKAIVTIDEALDGRSRESRAGDYVNALQQIESLRLFCNLGLHYHSRHDKSTQVVREVSDWARIAQGVFNNERQMGPIECSQCSSTLELTETLFEDTGPIQKNPQFASCMTFVCGDCTQRIIRARHVVRCTHKPGHDIVPVSTTRSALESSLDDIRPEPQGESLSLSLPSKIQALITDIKTLPQHEKCIVFSTWRLTLNVVEAGLNQASLQSVRFDGKVPQRERQNIVDKFKTDSSVRVMLLTLACGAAGLTLTVATRAYLMEPHWNPTLEEQALARIHRIGQTQNVTTVRFYVRDSFEQQVMEVQESKKHLAGVLLSAHDGGQADVSQGRLQTLRSLL